MPQLWSAIRLKPLPHTSTSHTDIALWCTVPAPKVTDVNQLALRAWTNLTLSRDRAKTATSDTKGSTKFLGLFRVGSLTAE
jgi:hypothetical protein